MAEALNILKRGMKIDHEQEGFLIRVFWVVAVTGHIMWVCGFLAAVGLNSPFVQAGELQQFKAEQSAKLDALIAKQDGAESLLKRTLAQGKAREIRDTLTRICEAKAPADKTRLNEDKDRLQEEFMSLTGYLYIEPPCEQLR